MPVRGRFVLALAGVFAALLIGVGSMPFHGTAKAAQTSGVSIRNFTFSPATVKVAVGDTVRWINDEDAVPHDATSEKVGDFYSGHMGPGASYSKTFTAAGAYPYFCMIHPGMRGIILVGDATGAPSPALAPLPARPINLKLTGQNEVPANSLDSNGGFTAQYDAAAKQITFSLQGFGLGITQAHIHQGAAGTNGPVVAFLFGPVPTGQNIVDVSGTVKPENLVGPLAGKWDDFVAALASGNLYVNAHTLANPAGEFRAQIPGQSGSAPRPPATGTGVAGGSDVAAWWPGAMALLVAAMFVTLTVGGSMLQERRRR